MSESERIDAYGSNSGEEISSVPGIDDDDAAGVDAPRQGLPRERLTPRRRAPRPSVTEQLLDTGQFVECIFSCPACGLSGTSIARPCMLEGKTCLACGELVSVTVV
jgi:hypothetical protein